MPTARSWWYAKGRSRLYRDVIHRSPWRNGLEILSHGLGAPLSDGSLPRRRTPPRWRKAACNPCSSSCFVPATRRSAPPPTCGVGPGNLAAASALASRSSYPPWPMHSLAHLFATSSGRGLGGLRTTSTLTPIASSAHLLPLPSHPASSHRREMRESPLRADSH